MSPLPFLSLHLVLESMDALPVWTAEMEEGPQKSPASLSTWSHTPRQSPTGTTHFFILTLVSGTQIVHFMPPFAAFIYDGE